MKNTEKTQRNEHRGLQKGGLKKWLSGFLAVSTVVTMLTGQAVSFYGDEPDNAYALAGEGSEENITIHFGANEDTSISIHVNPETGEEESAILVGLGSEEEAETEADTEADSDAEAENTGLKEVEAGDLVTISPADETLLPEEAEASAEILNGRAENTAVEKVEEVAGVEPASGLNAPAGDSAQDKEKEETTGVKTASDEGTVEASEEGSTEKTEYQVFEISLENVDEEQYQEGFKVEVSLPEDLRGRDFRLFHIHEGEDPVEIPVTTVGTVDHNTGLEVVSGFEFQTYGFSEFVLQYTVDFHWEVNGRKFEFSIPGGGFVSLEHLVKVLGITRDTNSDNKANTTLTRNDVEAGEAARQFAADVSSVVFSNPELVDVSKVKADTTVGQIKESRGLECRYSAELTEEQIDEINAQTVEAGDWALISVQPFNTEESLTVTMKNGDQFVVHVTDAQSAATDMSQFATGNTNRFVIWSTGGNDTKPYALMTDGTTALIDPDQIDSLGPEYQWTITPDANAKDRYNIRPAEDPSKALVLNGYQTGAGLVISTGNPGIYLYPPYTDHKNQRDDNRTSDNAGWLLEGWDWTRLNLGWITHQFESNKEYCSNINITRQEDHPQTIALSPMNENGILPGSGFPNNVTSTHYKKMTIDGYLVDDNNDANLDKARIYIPVDYNGNGTATITLPSNSQLSNFSVSSADTRTHSITQDSGKYQWVLHGWVNIATGEYYDVTSGPATATVSQDNLNVFYADWWAADYNYTIPEGQRADTVDTSSFVNIKMWDYNEMYNLRNSTAYKPDGDAGRKVPRDSIESEEWYINGGSVFQFVDNTDGGNCWQYGSLGNTQFRNRYNPNWSYYDGTGILGILGSQGQAPGTGVLESLFPANAASGSGVKYLGQSNYLFSYNDTTKTYSYDSKKNGAVYNQSEGRFYVSTSPRRNHWRGGGGGYREDIGFFPLNDATSRIEYNNGTTNNWFGMSIDLDFWLPDSPGSSDNANLIAGQHMRFEFNGDDDVWVLIDGKLALDIGGIHEAVDGTIDFSTGIIQNAKGNIYSLSDMGIGAGVHTLSFYYLERGGNASNCKITFNIVPRWDDDPEKYGEAKVTKTWDEGTPEEARQALSFSLQTHDGTLVPNSTVGYADGTESDGVWSYVWRGLDPNEDYQVVESPDPRFTVTSKSAIQRTEKVWAAASYHKNDAFGENTILIGNDRTRTEGGKLFNGNGSSDNADIVYHVVVSPDQVSDVVKWTVEGYSESNQHFYLKNASGQYLSVRNGSIAFVANASNASWFYMSPSGDLNDANSDYRLKVNGDGSIGVGAIINSADETDTNSPDRVHVYRYFDFFAKTTNYDFENTFKTKEITVSKAWSDSPGVNHTNDTITISLYQIALNHENEPVAEVEYPITSPNTDTIKGSGTITLSGLPVAGVYEGQFVTYEYRVAEKNGKAGYISQVQNVDTDSNTWIITNVAPDSQDKTTSVKVTKNWKHPDGTDAQSGHENDEITFKLLQRAVVSNYVPVTINWVNGNNNVAVTQQFYTAKNENLTLSVNRKLWSNWGNSVTMTTDRGDSEQWTVLLLYTSHNFNVNRIVDGITVSVKLNNSKDSWTDNDWSHSVTTTNLKSSINDVVKDDKSHDTAATEEYNYTLHKDDVSEGPFDESAANWMATIDDLPFYKKISDGIYYTYYYTLSEVFVNGKQVEPSGTTTVGATEDFTVSIDQENMTLTNTEKEKVTVIAAKAWQNADASTTPPEGANVRFELYADGAATGKVVQLNGKKDVSENPGTSEETIKDAGNSETAYESPAWTAVWTDLQKYTYQEDGTTDHVIIYTIREVTASIPEGYAVDYGTNGEGQPKEEAASSGTITNRQLTTSLEILKVNADGMIDPLEGAKFELRRVDPDTVNYSDTDVILPETGREDHKTGTNGKAVFTDLTSGYYEVKEAELPPGYVLTSDRIFYIKVENGTVSLVKRWADGKWHPSQGDDKLVFTSASADGTLPATATVGNTPGAALPASGGPGTGLFTILGSILVLGAGVLLWRRRRLA